MAKGSGHVYMQCRMTFWNSIQRRKTLPYQNSLGQMGQAGQWNNDNNLSDPSGVPVVALTGKHCPDSTRMCDSMGQKICSYLIDDYRFVPLSRVSHLANVYM